jgi:hypothetical protein
VADILQNILQPVETSRNGGEGKKGERCRGLHSSMIHLIHCKNFCKCYHVPPPSTIKEKKERKKYFSNIIPLNSPDSLV